MSSAAYRAVGALMDCDNRTVKRYVYARLRAQVKDTAVVCIGETGWRKAGSRRTLWGA